MSAYDDTWEYPNGSGNIQPVLRKHTAQQKSHFSASNIQVPSVVTQGVNWSNNLINGLIEPERRPAPISSGMINKPLNHEKFHDMKHDRFEVITDNSRQRRLKFNDKYRYAKHRSISFLPQE